MKKVSWFIFLAMLMALFLQNGCNSPTSLPTLSPTTIPPAITPASSTTTLSSPSATPPSPTATTISIPKVLLPVRGLYVQFERRGYPNDYWSGQAISDFYKFDDVVGHTVADEISLQLDEMKEMGVNTIAFELRSSAAEYIDGPFAPPDCNISPALGIQYPQPTPLEMTNLNAFLDLLESKGMNVYIRLVNTHMEEQPPENNELWLGTILNAVKDHPALDLVLFEGSAFLIDTNGDGVNDACGGPAEPGLWEGPTMIAAQYVKWAIGYAHSLGLPYRKLSAQAIVGFYPSVMQAPNSFMTDGHYWDPPIVLKGIFDELGVPNNERTYAISFYEHNKCSTTLDLPCIETNPHAWAIETVSNLFDTIGRQNGARVVAVEMGLLPPADPSWTTEMALQSLVWIMQNYGIDGGCFWRWTSFSNFEDLDATLATPLKPRGEEFTYNPIKDVLQNLYTEGQTNDLMHTADVIAPNIHSVAITPSVLKNGDDFEISANLGETHLFVTADLSDLDTSQTNPVTLIDQGDGTYKTSGSILLWNNEIDGTKQVRIIVMDFWSNAASTTVDVELRNLSQNSAVTSLNDTFTGNMLETNKWNLNTAGGGTVSQDDRLIVATDNIEPFSSAQVSSSWEFSGDFDVQVDFVFGEGWQSPVHDHLDGAYLGVNIAGKSYHITRLKSANQDKFLAWSQSGELVGEKDTDVTAGKYRLIRTGTTLYLLFDMGNGWQKLTSATVPEGPAQVYFGNGSINASLAFTTYFDNFKINYGGTN
jgi:hypothetical protein